jgi:hypothetical protein
MDGQKNVTSLDIASASLRTWSCFLRDRFARLRHLAGAANRPDRRTVLHLE